MMDSTELTTVFEDDETGDRFVIYSTASGPALEIRFEGETLWMTQAQMAELFGVSVVTINEHLRNVHAEGELEPEATIRKFRIVRREGDREVSRDVMHYNLDAIISVGYRVSSRQGTLFRKWATARLVEFATKAFVIDKARLKGPDYSDRIKELRDIVREIRADEANVYRELKSICAMCQDYDGASRQWVTFYQQMQAKLVYAVTSHTPSEVVAGRADAKAPNMGLQSWPNENIRKSDVAVSKNYLSDQEVRELNRLTTILLDIFEDQLDIGRLVMMKDAEALLEQQLKNLNRAVLRDGGIVASDTAKRHAEAEYRKFSEERKRLRHEEADKAISKLAAEAKDLPPSRGKKRK
ncbi:virulence RhuM family protein [Aquisalinus flavus]|nr:virulence RhuM family protein [Aquisalinus flavus]UNE49336.1 virulence RhuM family protein [Aquisalinus flavus]